MANEFKIKNGYLSEGNSQITGSLNVSGGITGSLFGTSSYAVTASYATNAANGGVTQLAAGSGIILSPTGGTGVVTVSSTGGSLYNTATGSYGSFYDTGSVLATSATAIYSMSLSTTDISNGVFVSASNGDVTRVKFTNAGTYNLQFSSQFSNTDNSNQDVVIWVRKNGVDIPDSSGVAAAPPFKAGSNGQVIAAWNYYLSLSAGDFIQMCWHVEQANVITLETIPAGVGPTHPRTPSTILTATRVDTFLSNTGSFSGSFTGDLLGTASYAPPAFPYTGSAGITGSLTVIGPTTSTRIGAGAAPSGSVPLDVRAQGTLATDIALRVRNSVNAANTFEVRGDGNAVFGGDTTSNRFLFGDAILLSGGANIARYAGTAFIKHRFTNNGTTAYFEIDPANSIIYSDSSMNMSIGASTAGAKLDVRAQGALSTNLAFRVRNSADTANLGAIYGNGTVNLGNSNFDFQSTETSGRTAVIGASNTGASYNTYSILSILGHNNSIASYGHTSYVGINSSINQNSGGTITGMGESNTLSGGTIGIGMNNSIAGSANSNMNTGIGYNNAIQYEKTNTFLLGNNLRVSAAGAASMTKIGWANSAGTLAQIDRSFEVYLNGQSGSDFHVTGKTNVVLKNNSVLVSGTNYEAAATNVLTIHNGVAPTTNITGAFQLYSSASSATILGSLVVNQTATTQSLNTSTRKLTDSSAKDSILWSTRELWDADPATLGYNTASLDWNNRIAKDANADTSIAWGTRVLVYNGGAALNWKERILYTPDSTTALNWADDTYLDSNVYQRDYKSSATQDLVSTNYNNPNASYLGDVIEVDGTTITIDGTVTDGMLVYLDNATDSYLPVDQTTVTNQLLGIAHNVSAGTGWILLEGHVVVDDQGPGGPLVQNANQGGAVYMKQGTGAGVMDTTPPTTGTNTSVMGHCYYNNSGSSTQWMMKFRPMYA